MSWFEISDGRMRFAGRLTRDPIREWLATPEGVSAVAAAARSARFSLFGRARAARRRISRALWEAISMPAVRQVVAAGCEGYVAGWTALAYAPSLPRVSVEYRRVVVVPRVMILWRVAARIGAQISAALESTAVPDGFRMFFSRWVVNQMDGALRGAGPSPQRPLHAQESWACVALDHESIWVDVSRSGPEWQGHVVMFEMPSPRLPRRERQALEAAIAQLTTSLPNLSRLQRDKTVRLAMDQMTSVRA
jgi:hypothetical protein